jgi:peptidoglycan/xylan/chitin deacetylase (PgdA/CDA1 family)
MHDDLLTPQTPSMERVAIRPVRDRQHANPLLPLLRKIARGGLALADTFCARVTPERPGLVILALHSLCATRSQVDDTTLAHGLNVSVEDFDALVQAVLESGYTAVSPRQVAEGLDPSGKYAMLTFDDGYFNNVLALDVLERHGVPATFFVSSNHVLEQKAFWWDSLNRELVKTGISNHARILEIRKVKKLGAQGIDAYMHRNFGANAFRPHSDSDRPFTRGELMSFARHKWVHLGNHTSDHAILTGCTPQEMARQIQDCQHVLTELAGYAPVAIAYPNGNHSPAVVDAALAAGLRVGVTVQPRKNHLPLDGPAGLMTLGRFYYYGGHARAEFAKYRSGIMPSQLVKKLVTASA